MCFHISKFATRTHAPSMCQRQTNALRRRSSKKRVDLSCVLEKRYAVKRSTLYQCILWVEILSLSRTQTFLFWSLKVLKICVFHLWISRPVISFLSSGLTSYSRVGCANLGSVHNAALCSDMPCVPWTALAKPIPVTSRERYSGTPADVGMLTVRFG